MAQNSWPFVGGGGTAVNEDQWSIMARFWAQSGVTDYANTLEVYGDSSGRQVKVKTGRACVRGHWYENTAVETVAIAANASGNPRIDRIVLRLDPSANSIVLAVVQGTPAGSPSAPALTQTDVGTYELTLARVAVANGASTITAGNVTDERTYVDGIYGNWSPAATGSSANPTANSSTGRYTRVGKKISGWGRIVGFTYGGAGEITLSLPVTPRDNSGYTRLGVVQLYSSVTNTMAHFQLELHSGKARPVRQTHGTAEDGDSLVTYKYLTGSDMSTFVTSGTVTIEYSFDYEAA
jgi:hypothetical protein